MNVNTQEMGQSNVLAKILCSDVAEDHQIVFVGMDILVFGRTLLEQGQLAVVHIQVS